MGARRTFSAEYKREAVAMLDAPRVTVSQIAADLGMGANVLGRWQHPSPGKRILQMECINPPHQREPPL